MLKSEASASDDGKPPVGVPAKLAQGEEGRELPSVSPLLASAMDGRCPSLWRGFFCLPPPPEQQMFLKLSHREHEVSGRTSGYREVTVCPNPCLAFTLYLPAPQMSAFRTERKILCPSSSILSLFSHHLFPFLLRMWKT